MALRPKAQIGTMACLCCGKQIPVRRSENGTLNLSCSWCEFPGYVKAGTDAHDHVMRRVELIEPAPVKDERENESAIAAQAAPQKTAPAARKNNSIFGV
jgi:hypothetical protein